MAEPIGALALAAWLTGLAGGSGHCLGMCGGIVAALGVRRTADLRGYAIAAAAHAGRVLGYSAAGALAGALGAGVLGGLFGTSGLGALRIAAAVLVLVVGVQLLSGRPLLMPLERLGARFWRRIAPLVRGLLPPRDPLRALALGALWGWLPCGLVYAQLTVAAASGGALPGAIVMAAFGLGTTVSLSLLSALLLSLGLGRLPRQASGALLFVLGVWMLMPLMLEHDVSDPVPQTHTHFGAAK
jgi:sulfite exporter TauE/SafE